MSIVRTLTRIVVPLSVLTLFLACGVDEGRACYPGDYLGGCTCDSGDHGYQRCGEDGTYGACDCSPLPFIPDAGTDAGNFMATCTTNADCDTNLCFAFNAKGSHCTKPCETATDCPLPSTGCSNNKVCKAP